MTEERMASRYNLLVLGVALAVAGCSEASSEKKAEIRPVRTTVVAPKVIANDRTAVGEVRPRYESDVGFRVSGKMTQRLVDVGGTVKKGDVLARVDDQDYRNKLTSAETDIATAQAVLLEAEAAEGRLRHLRDNGHTTQANYDVAVKNLRSAEAKVEAARAAAKLAADQVSYCELRADFDGVVTSIGAEAGQVVSVGQLIVRLAQPEEKDAVFAVAESVIVGTKPEDRKPKLAITLLSNPDIKVDGEVREVSPVADAATRTFLVKATLKDPPDQLRFGASVVGRLKTSTEPVVVLPASALFDKAGQPAVWVVDPQKSTVSLKTITVTRYETDRVVVGSGLQAGETVVTAGVNRLRESQKVRLAEANAK